MSKYNLYININKYTQQNAIKNIYKKLYIEFFK